MYLDLFKTNRVSVADRQFIHEIFDWRCTDEQEYNKPFRSLFFSEIEIISEHIYDDLTHEVYF